MKTPRACRTVWKPRRSSRLLFLFEALWFGAWVAAASPAVRAEEPAFRDLVRKYIEDPEQELPGLPEDIERVVALEYTVLLNKDGVEEAVDASTHRFQLGDQIRLRIEALNEMYIYIFQEGASGKRECLLPTEKEEPPLAKRGQTLDLPADGFFTFSAPPGDEKVIVVALEKPSDDLAALADVVFKKSGDELTPEEKAIQEKLKARIEKTLKSIRQRQAQGTKYRGLFTNEALEKISQEMGRKRATRAILEEPPHGDRASTFAMAAFRKHSPVELSVTIPLKSVSQKSARP